nr:putative reverse transcriptase domain-containing protein [Tanacetum cinerariifolium]
DKHRRSIEFQPGDRVFLNVSPARGVRRFDIKGKLSPRFIRPFEILDRVEGTSIILFMSFHIRSIRSVRIYLVSRNLRLFWIVKIES